MGGAAKIWQVLMAILISGATIAAEQDERLDLRREYNQILAIMDTLMRQFGPEQLERLSRAETAPGILPADMDLVLIFWADDEAEIFLNGFRVGDTRLSPTQIEIPSLYLRDQNVLRVHCWDTDRVESGFMAGLYLRDPGGRLRRVLVSQERGWRAGEGPAQEIYYNHPQPDIPGAQVIWGPTLFGEIWLEAVFAGSTLQRAARSRALANPDLETQKRPMDVHKIAARLVQLQERREALARELEKRRSGVGLEGRFKGYATSRLAFTLGKAAPLNEKQSITISTQLHEWASSLPEVHKQLIFRQPQALKGADSATPATRFEGGKSGREDRRADYQPPPERGPGGAGKGQATGFSRGHRGAVVQRGVAWGLWGVVMGLALYVGVSGRQWWRLFNGKVWKN